MTSNQMSKTVRYSENVFERIRVLGKGAFGTAVVHKRHHDGALVVLKEIDLVELKKDADRMAAIQEAQIMSKLSHPNIIKYHNAYTTETKLVIEMEYARLGTLQAYLSYQSKPLDELEIFQIFRQILFGLDYLHSKSIVHLDLKMANIFVTSEGCIKIGDFGIAKFIKPPNGGSYSDAGRQRNSRVTATELHKSQEKDRYQLGTLAYSSPERCLGEPTDAKSDIWSLGCILYELTTLKPLFSCQSLADLVLSIIRVHFEPIQRADIQPAIKRIFEQMIARHPEDRPSANDLIKCTDQMLLRLQLARSRQGEKPIYNYAMKTKNRLAGSPHRELPTDKTGAFPNGLADGALNSINYKHSLVYQVRLSSHDLQVDRVNLPQSKRIKKIVKGRSHYLVLTYDDIVYGWGSKRHGQLGACNLFAVKRQQHFQPRSPSPLSKRPFAFTTRSARNSLTARDLQILSPADGVARFPEATRSGVRFDGRQTDSFTQPPSLSSSTQTIVPNCRQNQSGSSTSLMATGQGKPSHRQQFELLAASQPATRPIVISELNKRKISQVAAGNDFSVFLSKTGIVMTCGDGSKGCLGRGDLASSFTPCMVDGLLNMDVTSIAAGPEHVVAVCSNGQAFAWGNSDHGRLGLAQERLTSGSGDMAHGHRYVLRPQLVDLKYSRLADSNRAEPTRGLFIKSVFCGDNCSVFIDSNYQCWACGRNRSNRLGLDRKRRFRRTIIVRGSWFPRRISALARERIVSCSIGENHASYLTADGRMLVLGQDIDHSHRLKMDLTKAQGRRRSFKEPSISQKLSHLSLVSQPKLRDAFRDSSLMNLDHKSLIDFMLRSDSLDDFKISPKTEVKCDTECACCPHKKWLRTSRSAKRQVEAYLRRSRAMQKMPFDRVVGMSCTSKFTLALTSDNRVYFWGTRTHEMDDYGKTLATLKSHAQSCAGRRQKTISAEPQLVAGCSDECFVKIGAANSSLMSTIQLIGSDQPIILARNPRLTARSLCDLWILDYSPAFDGSAEHSNAPSFCSRSSSYCSSIKSSTCGLDGKSVGSSSCSESVCCSDWNPPARDRGLGPACDKFARKCPCSAQRRHDAILEPQPIVSLYVPAMFNHSGCALQLVNLFCFDEDRFFLVLDTSVKLQQPVSFGAAAEPKKCTVRARSQSFKAQHERAKLQADTHPTPAVSRPARTKLNMVEELKSGGSSSQENTAKRNSSDTAKHSNDLAGLSGQAAGGPSDLREFSSAISIAQSDKEAGNSSGDFMVRSTKELSQQDDSNVLQVSPVSFNCLSLEEPRSMSTFAPGFNGNNIAILGRSQANDQDGESLRRLSFERSQHLWHCESNLSAAAAKESDQFCDERRLENRLRNASESTVVTGGFEDDTSSMPTWVKNEYIQEMCANQRADETASESEPTCFSDFTLTEANGDKHSSSSSDQDDDRATEVEWPARVTPDVLLGRVRRLTSTAAEYDSRESGSLAAAHQLSASQPNLASFDSKPESGSEVSDQPIGDNLLDCCIYRSLSVSSEQTSSKEDVHNQEVCQQTSRPPSAASTNESENHANLKWNEEFNDVHINNIGRTCQPEPSKAIRALRSRANSVSYQQGRRQLPFPKTHEAPPGAQVADTSSTLFGRSRFRQRFGSLQDQSLSRSAYFANEFDCGAGKIEDLNNNYIDEAQGRREMARSRSSLSSIRKSLVRIFC